jgi:hypothetical protein
VNIAENGLLPTIGKRDVDSLIHQVLTLISQITSTLNGGTINLLNP